MHKITSQAKRQAWSNNDGSVNYNPFGKLWNTNPRRAGDEEDGLSRTVSDGRVLEEANNQRRSDLVESGIPHHANTMPAESSSPRDVEAGRNSIARDNREDTSTTQGTEKQLVNGNGQARRRKMGGLLGKMHIGKGDKPEDEKRPPRKEPEYTFLSQIQHTILNSWINVLLIMAPVGIALNYTHQNPVAIFVVNFIAIIPLAALLSYATEEIALRVGEVLGGLLNASFGNAVELIVSLFALFDDQIDIVQTSLIGSMLSNLLLVMGMCFFLGGLKRIEQHFNVTVAQTAASLLSLAIGSLIIPTVYDQIVGTSGNDPDPTDNVPTVPDKAERLTQMSRGTAILLLLVYACYLYFQLSTHVDMYNEPSKKAQRRKPKLKKRDTALDGDKDARVVRNASVSEDVSAEAELEDDDEPEVPKLTLISSLVTLAGSTALVAVCAEAMVDSIDAITEGGTVSREFVGLILLPIVGNAAEHATAVTVAIKDKMDLAIGVAVGSSMQIALLVLPLIVVIGWIAGKTDMNMAFDGFQVIVLFVSVLLVNYLIGDGKSHWLEGVLLNILYLIIAIAAWFYPSNQQV